MARQLEIIELENGNYYYIEQKGNKFIAGTACNVGFLPEFEVKTTDIYEFYEKLQEYDFSKNA